MLLVILFFFFFQAEDGIRDGRVTGVQTCALPIYKNRIVHMKSPAKKMPIAIRTPSCEKPIEPLRISARNPTAVVSAPKKTARPSLATDVAIADGYSSPSIRAC